MTNKCNQLHRFGFDLVFGFSVVAASAGRCISDAAWCRHPAPAALRARARVRDALYVDDSWQPSGA